MRAFQGIVPTPGQVPVLVGTSYDVVVKVYERLDDIMRMGLILDRTADFLFFHFDVPWGSINQTQFTGDDSYGRQLKIMDLPMVYVNGVRVPQDELTVLSDGTLLELTNAVAPGDQVHIAAFGFNADGTMYFHPLLAIDRLLGILADVETLRDQMSASVANVTEMIDVHRDELATFDTMISTTVAYINSRSADIDGVFARSRSLWVNSGFEQGSDTIKGFPYGWQGEASNPTVFGSTAGRSTNVPENSVEKSTRAFGNATASLGRWWYITKLFKVSGGDSIATSYRYWSASFLSNPGANALNADFMDTNDTFVEVVTYDSTGQTIETIQSKSLSHLTWAETGAKPLNQTWLSTNFLPILLHVNAAFAEVRLVFASGSGAATGRSAYQSTATGSHRGLVDDVNFYSVSGETLIEVSPELLGTTINAQTSIANSQASSGYATAAGQAATAAIEQRVLAQTAAAGAALVHTQVAQALEDAESASASASDNAILTAQANFEASERARGNLIGKATFEDSSLGSWAPQGSAYLVPSVVPELHPRGRTVAMEHGGGVAHYASMSDDGWFHEDLNGRTFNLETWVYNASDSAIEIGVEVVAAGTGTAYFIFHSMEGGLTYDWVKLDEQLPAFTVVTAKWRPALRVSGIGTAYWSDLVFTDTSSLAAVQGVAAAVAVQLVEVQAYASEVEEYALSATLDALAAETSRSNAEIQAGMSTTAANDAQAASAAAQNYLNMTAQVSASGASIINDVFLGITSWTSYLTGGTATSVPNQKYLSGRSWTLTTTGSGNIGITLSDANFTGAKNASSVVVEVEFEMISGTLNGLAAQMLWSNSGAIANTVTALFTSDSKLHNTPGVLQKARLILDRPAGITTANFTEHTLRIVVNGAAPLGAKSVKLHLVSVRPTTAEELDTLKLRADITNIFDVRADHMSGTALAGLLQQLEVGSGTGVSAWVTQKASAITNLQGNASASYSFRVGAGGAAAGLELVAYNNAASGAAVGSNIKINADYIGLFGDVFVSAGDLNLNYDMLRAEEFSSPNGASFSFVNATDGKLGARYISIASNPAEKEARDGWFPISSADEYLATTTAWLSGTSGTVTVAIEFATVVGASAATLIAGSRVTLNTRTNSSVVTQAITSVTPPATAKRARFVIIRAAGGTSAALAGGFKLTKKAGADLIIDGGILARHIGVDEVKARHIGAGEVHAENLKVDGRLELDAQTASLTAGKSSPSDMIDGVAFGRFAGKFGLAASRTGATGNVQSLELTEETGLKLQNARHRVSAAILSPAVTVSTAQTVSIPSGTAVLSLVLIGGGGGGSRIAADGGAGGATVVSLYENGAPTGISWTAAGGVGKHTEHDGQSSIFGAGGKGNTYNTITTSNGFVNTYQNRYATSPAVNAYGAGGGGGGWETDLGEGGKAGTLLEVQGFSLSAYAGTLSLVVSPGQAGLGAPDGPHPDYRGAAGAAGVAIYQVGFGSEIAADVLPIRPTATGSFAKAASATGDLIFPNLGPGLWVLDTGTAYTNLDIGTITIDSVGSSICVGVGTRAEFIAEIRPNITAGRANARTIFYKFYSMTQWG